MMYLKTIILVFISVLLVSCDYYPDYQEIGDGYYLVDDFEMRQKYVACNAKFEGDNLVDSDMLLQYVADCRNTKDYILVRQKMDAPNGYDYDAHLAFYFEQNNMKPLLGNGSNASKVFKHGLNNTYYYIIKKSNHYIYGPYIYEEFVEKCDELGIEIF